MKTVGDLLKAARIKNGYSLEQIATHTRIAQRYLVAIEDNDFHQLPPAAFSKGFLRTYATIVGIDPKTVLAIFRRDYDQDDRGRIIPRSLTDPIKPAVSSLLTRRLGLILTLIGSLCIVAFFLVQILNFLANPPLKITQPSPGSLVQPQTIVSGLSSPQAAVTINNRPVIIDANGNFSLQLELTPGPHTLVVTATSRGDKKTVIEVPISVAEPTQ